jgi:hypothetical protein
MPDTPQAIAEKGEKIYREKYQEEYERRYLNKFVAIDITTGKAFVADSPTQAILEARQGEQGGGPFHVIKIGSPGVYRVGYTTPNHHDWIFGR